MRLADTAASTRSLAQRNRPLGPMQWGYSHHNARTRSGHLQLGLGAGLEERKDAVLRLFHIDRCSLLVRSIGRGRAVKAGKAMDVRDVLYFIT